MHTSRGVRRDGDAPLLSVDIRGRVTGTIGSVRGIKAAEEIARDGIDDRLLSCSEGLRSPNVEAVAGRKFSDDHANPTRFDGEVNIFTRRYSLDGVQVRAQLEVGRGYRSRPGIVGGRVLGGAVHNLATVRVEHRQIREGIRPGTIRSLRERHLVAIGLPTRTAIYGVLESHGKAVRTRPLSVVAVIPGLRHRVGRRVIEESRSIGVGKGGGRLSIGRNLSYGIRGAGGPEPVGDVGLIDAVRGVRGNVHDEDILRGCDGDGGCAAHNLAARGNGVVGAVVDAVLERLVAAVVGGDRAAFGAEPDDERELGVGVVAGTFDLLGDL